eukprot:5460445-Alexandrium_andersonii.AAC.1
MWSLGYPKVPPSRCRIKALERTIRAFGKACAATSPPGPWPPTQSQPSGCSEPYSEISATQRTQSAIRNPPKARQCCNPLNPLSALPNMQKCFRRSEL